MSRDQLSNEQYVDPPMWCDGFDMDLPKIVPEAKAALGELAVLDLLTYGHTTHGRLNHPSVWNHSLGMVAFFWRPTRPTCKPAGYYTGNDAPVPCTLWEAIRDAWVHDFVLIFEHDPVWDGDTREHFDPLMWHIRGWGDPLPEAKAAEHRACVLDKVKCCAMLVRAHIERESQSHG